MEGAKKRSFIESLREKYRRSKKKGRGEILDLVVNTIRVSRRQAKRLMAARESGRPKTPLRAGRPGKYQDSEFRRALREVWRKMRYMCSRSMKSALPEWLADIEKDRGEAFPEHVRIRLLEISSSTIDRLLTHDKIKRGKSLTRSGGFREQIPIQENVWDIQIPGFFEADTVAHCGGSLSGEFIYSMVMVDIASIWTEARAVYGKGSTPIVSAIEDIENCIPFPIRGYDSDNGTEVLNSHVLRYFRDERTERNRPPVQITRSREYKKNDQAHVEQRNDSVARKWLGYERFEFSQLQPLINYYYSDIVCPMLNHFFPVFKLHDKIRVKSKTRRVYKTPITPYQRIMQSAHVDGDKKDKLREIHQALSPITLSKLQIKVRDQIDRAQKALREGKCTPAMLKIPDCSQNLVSNFRLFQDTELPNYKSGT